jgi:hypothetical protein
MLLAALCPRVYSASNWKYQKQKNVSGEQSAAGTYGGKFAAICEPIV